MNDVRSAPQLGEALLLRGSAIRRYTTTAEDWPVITILPIEAEMESQPLGECFDTVRQVGNSFSADDMALRKDAAALTLLGAKVRQPGRGAVPAPFVLRSGCTLVW